MKLKKVRDLLAHLNEIREVFVGITIQVTWATLLRKKLRTTWSQKSGAWISLFKWKSISFSMSFSLKTNSLTKKYLINDSNPNRRWLMHRNVFFAVFVWILTLKFKAATIWGYSLLYIKRAFYVIYRTCWCIAIVFESKIQCELYNYLHEKNTIAKLYFEWKVKISKFNYFEFGFED